MFSSVSLAPEAMPHLEKLMEAKNVFTGPNTNTDQERAYFNFYKDLRQNEALYFCEFLHRVHGISLRRVVRRHSWQRGDVRKCL